MRRGILALLLAAAVAAGSARADPPAAPPACAGGGSESAPGAIVLDARSLRLADGRTLRLAGIEPFDLLLPEAQGAAAELESRLTALLTPGPFRVQMADAEPDRYGRLPALIWAGNTLLQETVAGEGLAIAFAKGASLPCFDRILAAEDAARRAKGGFWKDLRLPKSYPDALEPWIGRFAIFDGRVVSVGNRPARSYLDFGRRWRADVTVEIPRKVRDLLGGETTLSALAGRRVRVRGFLQERDGPLVILGSPLQLQALDPPATNEVTEKLPAAP